MSDVTAPVPSPTPRSTGRVAMRSPRMRSGLALDVPHRPHRAADGPAFRRAMRAALCRPAEATRAFAPTREEGPQCDGAGIPPTRSGVSDA